MLIEYLKNTDRNWSHPEHNLSLWQSGTGGECYNRLKFHNYFNFCNGKHLPGPRHDLRVNCRQGGGKTKGDTVINSVYRKWHKFRLSWIREMA